MSLRWISIVISKVSFVKKITLYRWDSINFKYDYDCTGGCLCKVLFDVKNTDD